MVVEEITPHPMEATTVNPSSLSSAMSPSEQLWQLLQKKQSCLEPHELYPILQRDPSICSRVLRPLSQEDGGQKHTESDWYPIHHACSMGCSLNVLQLLLRTAATLDFRNPISPIAGDGTISFAYNQHHQVGYFKDRLGRNMLHIFLEGIAKCKDSSNDGVIDHISEPQKQESQAKYNVIKWMIEEFPRLVFQTTAHGNTPLHCLTSSLSCYFFSHPSPSSETSVLTTICKASPHSIGTRNRNGLTPFHQCLIYHCGQKTTTTTTIASATKNNRKEMHCRHGGIIARGTIATSDMDTVDLFLDSYYDSTCIKSSQLVGAAKFLYTEEEADLLLTALRALVTIAVQNVIKVGDRGNGSRNHLVYDDGQADDVVTQRWLCSAVKRLFYFCCPALLQVDRISHVINETATVAAAQTHVDMDMNKDYYYYYYQAYSSHVSEKKWYHREGHDIYIYSHGKVDGEAVDGSSTSSNGLPLLLEQLLHVYEERCQARTQGYSDGDEQEATQECSLLLTLCVWLVQTQHSRQQHYQGMLLAHDLPQFLFQSDRFRWFIYYYMSQAPSSVFC